MLGQVDVPERIAYARKPKTLLVVLSADEVVRFLEAVPSLKTHTALTTAYAAGSRASEAVGLKLCDIDSGRMIILDDWGLEPLDAAKRRYSSKSSMTVKAGAPPSTPVNCRGPLASTDR